jgi:hypothetical protein
MALRVTGVRKETYMQQLDKALMRTKPGSWTAAASASLLCSPSNVQLASMHLMMNLDALPLTKRSRCTCHRFNCWISPTPAQSKCCRASVVRR